MNRGGQCKELLILKMRKEWTAKIMTSSDLRSGNEPHSVAVGTHTWHEIQQQPLLWPTTAVRVQEGIARLRLQARLANARVVITGAGTSAYAAAAVAAAWPLSIAVPSTDLLLATERYIEDATVLISLARSGNRYCRRLGKVCSDQSKN